MPLLKQMAVAKSERAGTFDKPVVLLADVDKELMDELVESALEDSPPLEVVTRRGNPFDTEDLVRVNAHDARRVVVLHPHERDVGLLGSSASDDNEIGSRDSSDTSSQSFPEEGFQKQQREEALKAAVVLNLLADRGRDAFPDVVVQMPYRMPEKQDLVAHALKLASTHEDGASRSSLTGRSFRVATARSAANSPYVQVHGSENTGRFPRSRRFNPARACFSRSCSSSPRTRPSFTSRTRRSSWERPSARRGACSPRRRCAA